MRRKFAFTLVELLVVLAVIGLIVVFLIPMRRSVREPARRDKCLNNIKQIMLAILSYEEEHGSLPAAYTVDNEGNRLHSWRTLILPYLSHQELFESIDLTKAWDDPTNAEARSTAVDSYYCPSAALPSESMTSYLAIVGPNCVFSGPVPRALAEITDSLESTICVVDVNDEEIVEWMSPNDLGEENLLAYNTKTRTNHNRILGGFLDCHVGLLNKEEDLNQLPAMLTVSGGEEVSL